MLLNCNRQCGMQVRNGKSLEAWLSFCKEEITLFAHLHGTTSLVLARPQKKLSTALSFLRTYLYFSPTQSFS